MDPSSTARRRPEHPAVIAHSTGRSLTYRQLDEDADRFAHVLDALDVAEDAVVAVLAENRVEWAVVLWGAHRSGRWVAPVNWHLKPHEITHVLRLSRASVLVTGATLRALAAEAAEALPELLVVDLDAAASGAVDLRELMDRQPAVPRRSAQCGGRVMFSSGTTSAPKAIRHPGPSGLASDAPPHLAAYTELFALDAAAVYLSPAPTYHTAPYRFLHAVTQVGGTVVMLPSFDPEQALAAIQEHRVTHAQFVPTMLTRMLRLPTDVRERYDLTSLRVAITGAASCPPEVKEAIDAWWGPVLHELYGASESYGNCHISPLEARERRGSVGRALKGRIHITDAHGEELRLGESGRVWFEGAGTFSYEGADEATTRTRHPLGWTTVGDLGRLDEDGYLYLEGRFDHVVITGGVNVHPQEVEDLLAVHEEVADVAVVGVPDEDLGEVLVAYVVPTHDRRPRADLAQALREHCRERLAHVKCPRRVELVPHLPRAENGKLYKRLLEVPPSVGGGELRPSLCEEGSHAL